MTWRRSPRVRVYENPFFNVTHSTATSGDVTKNYYVVNFGRRVGVVAIDGERILMVRQYRFLADDLCWEVPGGTVEDGEDPICAAARETIEETGIEPIDLEPLLMFYPSLDTNDNPTHLFVASKHRVVAPFRPDASEVCEMRWMPVRDCLQMINEGRLQDGFTIIALLAYTGRQGA